MRFMDFMSKVTAAFRPSRFCSLSLVAGRWGVGVFVALALFIPATASAEMIFKGGVSETHYRMPEAKPAEKGVVGINLEIRAGDYPIIMEIYPGTPAARSSLRTGDTIVSVDSMDTHGMSRLAVDHVISDVPGRVIRFLVERDGRVFPVSLTVGTMGQLVQSDVKSLYRQEFGP